MNDKIGRFDIPSEMITEATGSISKMIAALEFVPIAVEFNSRTDRYEYTGYSPYFREMTEGNVITAYAIEYQCNIEPIEKTEGE